MEALCNIPPNPDISGIGVRAAIYAQNLLCFAPVVAHLWDGNVSADEMRGVKDQSIGMLAIAFAILISCIIEATASVPRVTSFHAAVILDLSWMNNTSTWIWFLLYAHHITKPEKEKEGEHSKERKPIPAVWSAWTDVLLFPLRRLMTGTGKAGPSLPDGTVDAEKGTSDGKGHTHGSAGMDIWQREHEGERSTAVQRVWYLVSQEPVLTLGSIHLSVMGALGLWLWSDRSKFGTDIGDCDPFLTIVGGTVPSSSPGLRVFSLAIYTLLVIPGLNLVLPFLFFLALHITYNTSRLRHPHFWRRLRDPVDLIRRIPRIDFHGIVRRTASALRGIPKSTSALFRRSRGSFRDVESGTLSADVPSEGSLIPLDSPPHNQATQAGNTPTQSSLNHTAFFIVGLVCLAFINIIQLVDIEITLLRNKPYQAGEEDEWGFGQVIALLLLMVPLRDFVTSIEDIREKVKKRKVDKEKIRKAFNDHLQQAVNNDTFDGHDFKGLIEQGADPKVELDDAFRFPTLLQFAAYKGNEVLVQYLIERGVEDTGGGAFHWAARHNQIKTACLLAEGRNTSDRAETVHRAIPLVVELLKHSDSDVCQAAIECLSGLGAEVDLIRPVISLVMELLKDSDLDIRRAAIKCLSGLGEQGMRLHLIQPAIPLVMELLKDSDSAIRQDAIKCLSGLGEQGMCLDLIRPAIPLVVELLKDSDFNVRQAAIGCISGFGEQVDLIELTIPLAVELLKDSDSCVRQAAIECLSGLIAQVDLIRPAIPLVLELLEDSDSYVRRAAIRFLSGLGAQMDLIQPAIPLAMELLKDSDSCVRQATIECLSSLGELGEQAIPLVMELLKDSDFHVRRAAIECLSGLGDQVDLIRPAISLVMELLKYSDSHIRWAAIECLSGLGKQVDLIRPAIPLVMELLNDSDSDVRRAVIKCLSGLEEQGMLDLIRPAIPFVVELLKDSDSYICQAAIECLSGLREQVDLIQPAIPLVVELLKNKDFHVCQAAIQFLSGLGAQADLIRPLIPLVMELLKDPDFYVRRAAIECLSGLRSQVDLIQPAIPLVVELLEDSHSDIRRAAIECLSGPREHGMCCLVHLKSYSMLRPPHSGLDPASDSLSREIAEGFR
ncbi:Multiple ankyrin repeats single kh domain [Mycena venus]|uniref:Multiple ankyrin repeats single kh domain n=1 Tax=Mycena venus TaxID=2733690 RepID=A0A8H7CGA2_9AGAR|nr:Multiple ankyrin repeats single kh domain [Mycena venus]